MTYKDIHQHVRVEGGSHIAAWVGNKPLTEWFCGSCGMGWDTLTPIQQATWRAEFGETVDPASVGSVPWDARWTAQPPLLAHTPRESKP